MNSVVEANLEDGSVYSDFIKYTHHELRQQCNATSTAEEEDAVWREHVQHQRLLQRYSESMWRLAEDVWRRKHADVPHQCRVRWVYCAVLRYFSVDQMTRARGYDTRLCGRHNDIVDWTSIPDMTELKEWDFLDVGSCYDPFGGLPRLRVTALDLCPAVPSVLKLDFLTAPLCTKDGSTGPADGSTDAGLQLHAESWHVVCMCLLLEYLPTARLRFGCCRRAARLLRPEGVLVLISPDSSHPTANSRLYRGWRLALGTLGLVRVRYEKTEHLHCMVFRKSVRPDLVALEARQCIVQDAGRSRLVWKTMSNNTRDASDNVRNCTEHARDGTDIDRNCTEHARDSTDNVRNCTEHAREGTDNVRNCAEHARDGTDNVRNCTEHARDGSDIDRNCTEHARDDIDINRKLVGSDAVFVYDSAETVVAAQVAVVNVPEPYQLMVIHQDLRKMESPASSDHHQPPVEDVADSFLLLPFSN